MPLLRMTDVSIAYGTHALLNQASFLLDAGERVGLLGRNGEGKTTLMKIISGDVHADGGEVWLQPGLKMARLEQAPELSGENTVFDEVAGGLGEIGVWIKQYHALSHSVAENQGQALKELGHLQHELEAHNGWHFQQRVETVLSRLDLPSESLISSLSGGWKRRVALAKALVIEPDILLLDEPTNHLDFSSINWLEEQLMSFPGALLFVTHDRTFLQKLATRIVDLDRGKLVSWPGNYKDYLRRKAAALEEEETQNAVFDKKLAQEEVWIRQGIKARRTRNEGRVRALKKLREQRTQRRNVQGSSKIALESGETSGKKVIVARDISFDYGDKPIVKHFSTNIQRGDKIGLIGPNGAGKTTLLQLLQGELTPGSGVVEQGTRLHVAYFDQLREQLDPEMSVADSVAEGNEFIETAEGKRHVMSYLGDFLFAPARARSPVKSLSGGEKNRLLLARLFTRPANLLVMDEPTNDLDLETLELLEEKLVTYQGTLLLVSHDREFLDNVVTSVFVFEGGGVINEYVGGYSDWDRMKKQKAKAEQQQKSVKSEKKPAASILKARKLSYKEQKELDQLPELIEEMENRQSVLTEAINNPEFYRQDQEEIKQTLEQLKNLEQELSQNYHRWDELEAMAEKAAG